jgi:hypothetical protein
MTPKKKKPASPEKADRYGGIDIKSGRDTKIEKSTLVGGDMISENKLQELFAPLDKEIEAAAKENPEKAEQAAEKVEELKQEVAKGEKANDGVLASLVKGIADLVPGAVSAIGTMFGQPILAGLAGPVTKLVLDSILKK